MKKSGPSYAICFWNYRLTKSWLDQCLKTTVIQQHSTAILLKSFKHLRNLHGNTCIIFLITLGKIELQNVSVNNMWNLQTVFLTHWLQMTSHSFVIVRICHNQFKCNCLKDKKSTVIQHHSTAILLKSSKHLRNLHGNTCIIFLITLGKIELQNVSVNNMWNLQTVFLTHWLQMTSHSFVIVRICHNQFKCNCLKNKKLFFNFLLHFWNLDQVLDNLKKWRPS